MTADTPRTPPAPTGAGAAGRRLWSSVVEPFDLDEHELALLRQACRTADLLDKLDAEVRRDGPMVGSGDGRKAHPTAVESRAQRIALARLLAALRLPAGESGERAHGFRRQVDERHLQATLDTGLGHLDADKPPPTTTARRGWRAWRSPMIAAPCSRVWTPRCPPHRHPAGREISGWLRLPPSMSRSRCSTAPRAAPVPPPVRRPGRCRQPRCPSGRRCPGHGAPAACGRRGPRLWPRHRKPSKGCRMPSTRSICRARGRSPPASRPAASWRRTRRSSRPRHHR